MCVCLSLYLYMYIYIYSYVYLYKQVPGPLFLPLVVRPPVGDFLLRTPDGCSANTYLRRHQRWHGLRFFAGGLRTFSRCLQNIVRCSQNIADRI